MTRRRPQKNLLSNRTASVSIHRNGLSVEIESVPATDAGLVSQALLDMIRNLIAAGYDELVVDGGALHGGSFGDVPEDDDIEDFSEPPSMRTRRIGFT